MGIVVDEFGNKTWAPHQGKQTEFIRLPDDIFEAFYGGAAGGGKTEALLMLPIAKGWWKLGQFRAVFFRRTFPQLESSLINRAKEFYEPLGATYNETKHIFTFPSGAKFRFASLETDADARRHDTIEYHYVAFEELTEFTEFQYTYLTSRIRRAGTTKLPIIIRSASNPGNIGHSWVRSRFVEPEVTGMTKLWDPESKTWRIFIPAKVSDNPTLMRDDPNYINRLRLLSEAEYRAKALGDWWAYEGQVFPEWRYLKYPNEPEHALHVIPAFRIPSWWPKILAVDWGFRAMMWAGWGAISPDGRVYLYREHTRKNTQIEIWAAEIARLSAGDENLVAQTLDPSAWQDRGQPETIAVQATRASGFNFDKADNDRLGGKMLVHEFLRWRERPPRFIPKEGFSQQLADRIFRMQGIKGLHEYQSLFLPEEPETNIPRLQVFEECKELIKAIPLCIYDEKNPEDVKEFNGDDPYDGLRYLLKRVEHYQKLSSDQAEKMAVHAGIMKKFEETKDYNYLHRAMEGYEAEYAQKTFAVPSRRSGKRGLQRALRGNRSVH